ncbi:MAG: 16S rRNA (guanine(966)-N(2))-methyltransferase RsmD [Peptoniphilus sp.]|nr:16S rRNA (guanine(966)-N(2))-methyltransferase RsmD [Peptoniphilus sp.]MDY3119292.1 16S rRNA (guanine(966)-N(2))-methyltransferase RsmD [Peptoniphilus sp.]
MRVIAGEKKGRRLKTPKGERVRPTEDRIKENVFNLLYSPFSGVCVLDLFAGTGHIGIEFLSRGAEKAWFCDNHPESLRIIRENIKITGYNEKSKVVETSFEKCLSLARDEAMAFDYIYVDPPYANRDYYDRTAKDVSTYALLAPGGRMVFEAPKAYVFSDYNQLHLVREKAYGTKIIWIYESCD